MAIDKFFEKEIGMEIDKAIDFLNEGGISGEDLEDIINKFRNFISEDIEMRSIPYEYRFLLINVVLFNIFKNTSVFYKKFIKALKKIEKGEEKVKNILEKEWRI